MPKLEHVIRRLHQAVSEPGLIVPAIKELESLVYIDDVEFQQLPARTQEVLEDLAYNLDLFEPNEEWRRQDPSYYGPERAVEEIRGALGRLPSEGAE